MNVGGPGIKEVVEGGLSVEENQKDPDDELPNDNWLEEYLRKKAELYLGRKTDNGLESQGFRAKELEKRGMHRTGSIR